MLILSRKHGEKITVGNGITISVLKINSNRVQIGIEAPATVSVKRDELLSTGTAGSSVMLPASR